MSEEILIEEIAYHRNGISGEGFYVVTFEDDAGAKMVGVVFDMNPEEPEPRKFYNPRTAVFDRELLGEGVIAFGKNSFRGDNFNESLRHAIRAKHNQEMAQL